MKTVDELKAAWNSKADKYNQWNELGLDEIIFFAQEEQQAEINYLLATLAALVERCDMDGMPNDSQPIIEIARAASKGETT